MTERSRYRRSEALVMAMRFVLTEYVEKALAEAAYDKLDDGTYAGRVPPCTGVVAFGATLRECEEELRSTLEDWILVGLRLQHRLPVIDGIDLNVEPRREPVETL
jgi:predicted RNase H-like HicB family nuclease